MPANPSRFKITDEIWCFECKHHESNIWSVVHELSHTPLKTVYSNFMNYYSARSNTEGTPFRNFYLLRVTSTSGTWYIEVNVVHVNRLWLQKLPHVTKFKAR